LHQSPFRHGTDCNLFHDLESLVIDNRNGVVAGDRYVQGFAVERNCSLPPDGHDL